MKKLNQILQSNIFYIIVFLLLFLYVLIYVNISFKTKLNINDNTFIGRINNIKIDKDFLQLELIGKEKIISFYYFKSEEEINNFKNNYKIGDKVLLTGNYSIPNNNTVKNLFNYKKYLYYKHIYLIFNIDKIEKISSNKNILYMIKNNIISHINKYKSKDYLELFILGNKSNIDNIVNKSYQENGISHLFSLSGMHITLLSTILLLFLNKLFKSNKAYIITCIILIIYMLLSTLSVSIIRSVLLFILLTINKILKFNIKTIKIFILDLFIILFYNPFYIFDVSFLYSFIITFYLILFSKLITGNYIYKLIKVSLISFFVGFPITINYFYQVNLLSIIYNLIFVPFISFIIFPLSLLTFFIPSLDSFLLFFVNILEKLSIFFNNINGYKLIFGKECFLFIIIYYLLLTVFLFTKKRFFLLLIILLIILSYYKNYFINSNFLMFLDVKQGDSLIFNINNKCIVIDTGGIISYKKEWQRENSSISDKTLIPFLKSEGIKKINYLILSHGDFDHMGEAINLVNNFRVEKVIFNCGPYNDLEKELIKALDKKNIKYYSCIKELNIDDNKLYFLQTKEYDNENDNSNVIYTKLNGYKFMFMGDAGVQKEKDILDKYNISNIDVLKVGHHGSKTSSGKEFINEINPKYSIISVGKNNRYGHPNKEVLDNLDNSKIYRTDQDGSIMFKIKNNKLKIETCSP